MTGSNSFPVTRIRDQLDALKRFGVAAAYFENYVNLRPQPHCVDLLLVSLVVNGHGKHWMNDAVYPESPGSLGITHYGEAHSIVSGPDGMEIYNLYLDPQVRPLPLMPPALRAIQQTLFFSREEFRHRLNRSVHLHFSNPALPVRCLETLHREQQNPSEGSSMIIDAMLRTFLIVCCRTALKQGIHPSLPPGTSLCSWFPKIRRILDEQYAEPLSLDHLAKQARISKSYLCRIFKQQMGLSIMDYLSERRIQAAMQQLQTTDHKILTIALESGFGTLSHFNRVFKQRIGIAPGAYRRQFHPPAAFLAPK
jgi:AraC-like DNA-binding protein